REGTVPRDLRKVSIERQVRMVGFPDEKLVEWDRQWLIERSGTPIETITAGIRQRLAMLPEPGRQNRTTRVARLS
ncbi:hypothetical protein ACKI1K_44800, partial [Streptomyces scabiei]|uniref:hypothetical protein n=1 Tax=Streptomyces scabiei TaxID=1930 RepID=UPI0038F6C71B